MEQCTCDVWLKGCSCGVAEWEKKVTDLETRRLDYIARVKKAELKCDDKAAYVGWECCVEHDELRDENREHISEAEALHKSPLYHVLSACWWQAVGKQRMYDILMDGK